MRLNELLNGLPKGALDIERRSVRETGHLFIPTSFASAELWLDGPLLIAQDTSLVPANVRILRHSFSAWIRLKSGDDKPTQKVSFC